MSQVESSLPVLYIGGIGRSGTTVFELSLGVDDRIVALGEVIHLWQRSLVDNEPCGCGEPFSRCLFWTTVGDVAFGGWDKIDPERVIGLKKRLDRTVRTPQLSLGLGSRQWMSDVREYASYYSGIYHAAAEVTQRSVVVDSSKQASLPYILQYAEGVDLRVLHCVRDSRAVAYSWTKTVRRPEARTSEAALMTRYSPSVLALKWLQHNLVIDALRLRRVPSTRLRYEDWVRDSLGALQQALILAGLSPELDSRIDAAGVDLPITHTCSGNPMRFTQGRVDIRQDEGWRTSLPWSSRVIVTTMTAPLLAAYGYINGTVTPIRKRYD